MASVLPAPAIGIDLGTTFSCVAVFHKGKVEIIKNEKGRTTIPSYVAFTENGRIVGERAKDLWTVIDPENTVNNMKRLIGKTLNDEHVREDIDSFLFKVVDDGNGNPRVKVKYENRDKLFRPEDISAMVLGELKSQAEEFLEVPVTEAVITVPAYFTDAQRQATMDAGKIAGLKVLGTINEPTAAALAYGFDNPDRCEDAVLVYDFGGGTFDVSLLKIVNGEVCVQATDGHNHLGGEDIDTLLLEHFVSEFKKSKDIDLNQLAATHGIDNAKRALRRMRNACEKAKIQLSSDRQSRIELSDLYNEQDYEATVSRTFFEEKCSELIRGTLRYVQQTVERENLCEADITKVILVGGSTRIPMVRDMLQQFLPRCEFCANINPDEAVAYGAAIQAAILSGVDKNVLHNVALRDVTPMSLGIETYGGIMATVIPRNSPLPVEKRKVFSTSKDCQTEICFQVFEGERHVTKYNNLLGEFTLVGIPPAPRRVPQIEVSFTVDANGILQVKATDLSMMCENGICITNNRGRLSEDEIRQAVQEAIDMRQQDLQFKKTIEARETLEMYANKIEKSLKNPVLREKVEDEEIRKITEAVDESLCLYESYLEPGEAEFENKRKKLESLWDPVIKKIYPKGRNDNSDAPAM